MSELSKESKTIITVLKSMIEDEIKEKESKSFKGDYEIGYINGLDRACNLLGNLLIQNK